MADTQRLPVPPHHVQVSNTSQFPPTLVLPPLRSPQGPSRQSSWMQLPTLEPPSSLPPLRPPSALDDPLLRRVSESPATEARRLVAAPSQEVLPSAHPSLVQTEEVRSSSRASTSRLEHRLDQRTDQRYAFSTTESLSGGLSRKRQRDDSGDTSPAESWPPSVKRMRRSPSGSFADSPTVSAPAPALSASSVVAVPPIFSPYQLRVRQQPRAARACGFGERDRRVIDPPPILQIEASDPNAGPLDIDALRGAFSVVHASIWDETGMSDVTSVSQPGRRTGTRLMGTLVASAIFAQDETGNEGVFFAFPDLSCRTYGRHRLRFALMRIDPMNPSAGGASPVLAQVTSDVFTVYSAKDFPGMMSSSALTRALRSQGHSIPVKKGKAGTQSSRDDDDDD